VIGPPELYLLCILTIRRSGQRPETRKPEISLDVTVDGYEENFRHKVRVHREA